MKIALLNGDPIPKRDIPNFEGKGALYEVMRVTNGCPIFLEMHLERLEKSAKNLKHHTPYFGQIISDIKKLISLNQLINGNIEIAFWGNGKPSRVAMIIPHHYTTLEENKNGVKLGILNAERENPQSKVKQETLRQEANRIIKENNLSEVLLENKDGEITEGSRSNIFFIKNGTVFTPPAETVLEGITRIIIFSTCKNNNIKIVEKAILSNSLSNYDAAFSSGTSRGVLPVCSVQEIKFNPQNTLLQKVSNLYEESVKNYLLNNCK